MSKTNSNIDCTILGLLLAFTVIIVMINAVQIDSLKSDVESLKVEQAQRLSDKEDKELKQEVIQDLVRMMQQGR